MEHRISCDIENLVSVIWFCSNKKFKWVKSFWRIVLIVSAIIPSNREIIARHNWVWKIWNNHESIIFNEFFQLTQKLCQHFKTANECTNWKYLDTKIQIYRLIQSQLIKFMLSQSFLEKYQDQLLFLLLFMLIIYR